MRHLALLLLPTLAAASPTAPLSAATDPPAAGTVLHLRSAELEPQRIGAFGTGWSSAVGDAEVRCVMQLTLSPTGRPQDARPIDCPAAVISAAKAGLMASRWKRITDDPDVAAVAVDYVVTFRNAR